jgi:hypothetical protein
MKSSPCRTRVRPVGPEGGSSPAIPSVFLTAREAAELLRVSPITLGRWRIVGCGPSFRKFGRRVVYAHNDLLAWAQEQLRSSTSDKS